MQGDGGRLQCGLGLACFWLGPGSDDTEIKKSKVDITQTWAVRILQIVFWLWPETYHYHRLRIVACSDFSVRLPVTAQLGADRLKA